MAASYLVRFDDLCPGMNWPVWSRVEAILDQNGVKPLVAVVPDNQDPKLNVTAPAADFWERVRGWQARGWAIGLHGYQHRYVTRSAGIIGRNRYSEFAGLTEQEQAGKIRRGLEIFSRHGVRADAWVAPAHSFDAATVRALRDNGVDCISDGYSLAPHIEDGMLWIPQQLGRFRAMPTGVWTVCLHVNDWTASAIRNFGSDLQRHRKDVVSLSHLRSEYARREASFADRVFEATFRTARAAKSMVAA